MYGTIFTNTRRLFTTTTTTYSDHSPGNHIGPQGRHRLERLDELAKPISLLDHQKGDAQQESKHARDGELIPDAAQTILESFRFHQFLIFISLDGSEHVGNACRNECRPGKVKLVDTSQDDTANDDGEAKPLGLGDGLVVDELREDGSECWFGGLDNLTKGDGAGREGEDGCRVCTGVAECHGEHFDNLLRCGNSVE